MNRPLWATDCTKCLTSYIKTRRDTARYSLSVKTAVSLSCSNVLASYMVHRDYSALRLARSITSHLAGSIATPFSHYLQRSVIPQLKTNLTATYAYPTPEPCVWHLYLIVKEGGLHWLGLELSLHYISVCITPNHYILLPHITTLY